MRQGGDFDSTPHHQSPPNSPPTLPTKRRGEVAEAAFLHKASSLGFSVAKPWGESDRYDFILDSGDRCWRVQVKSAHSSAINGYSFHACGNRRTHRYTRADIDFIVGYVVPADVWYVIPIDAFAAITTIKVFPSSRRRMSRYEIYREAWHHFGPLRIANRNDAPK
jgi:PD-(D/E)XK nuclease superfamily protein